jgi:hypothetical protein
MHRRSMPPPAPLLPAVLVPPVDAPPARLVPAVLVPPVAFEPPEDVEPPTAGEPPALLAPSEFRFVVPSEQATAASNKTEQLETNRIIMILASGDDPCLVKGI